MRAVAELYMARAVIREAQLIDRIVRSRLPQRRDFRPENASHPHLQSRGAAGLIRGGDESQRRFRKGEALMRQPRVAGAELLLDQFAMGGQRDIGVQAHRGTIIGIGGLAIEKQPGHPVDMLHFRDDLGFAPGDPLRIQPRARDGDGAAALQIQIEPVQLNRRRLRAKLLRQRHAR